MGSEEAAGALLERDSHQSPLGPSEAGSNGRHEAASPHRAPCALEPPGCHLIHARADGSSYAPLPRCRSRSRWPRWGPPTSRVVVGRTSCATVPASPTTPFAWFRPPRSAFPRTGLWTPTGRSPAPPATPVFQTSAAQRARVFAAAETQARIRSNFAPTVTAKTGSERLPECTGWPCREPT